MPRGTPVRRSTSSTRSAGTRFQLETAARERPNAKESFTTPPNFFAANAIGSGACALESGFMSEKSSGTKPAKSSVARPLTGDAALGARIKLIRNRRKLTQATLGKAAGVTKGSISQYENGVGAPSISVLARIAAKLEVPIETLISGKAPATMVSAAQRVQPYMSVDDRIQALPEAMREFVMLSLKRAEAAAMVVPEKFLRAPTSENWSDFAAYLEALSIRSHQDDPEV